MEIRQLRTFVHVAELGSFSLAAERLHIAQSALSRHIQSLETELKSRLFVRTGRGVELTQAGNVLLERAILILREVERTRLEFNSEQVFIGGEVSLGMPQTVADILSGLIIERFMERYPQVNLRLASGYSGHVLNWLQRGDIDVGILYEVNQSATVDLQPLLMEELFLIEKHDPERSLSSEITLAEVAAMDLALPSRQHGLRLLLDGVAIQHGCELKPIVEADSLQVQIDVARRGLGATILPFFSVYSEILNGVLTARPVVSPRIVRRLSLATSLDRSLSPAAERLAEMVSNEVKELIKSGQWKGTAPGEVCIT